MPIPVGSSPSCGCQGSIGSKTAKEGFTEERLVCDDFAANPSLRADFCKTFGTYGTSEELRISKLAGTTKTDCVSSCSTVRLQIKKGKKGQSGQVDRHWVDALVDMLPCLEPISHMLKGLCEYRLKPDGTVDKTSKRKLLTLENYTQAELDAFVAVLDNNKRAIIETVLLGHDEATKPTHMAYVSYDKVTQKRQKLSIWRMTDVVDSLAYQPSSISKTGATFSIGDALSFQRKGGDGGRKESNHLQAKIVPSKITVADDRPVVSLCY